MSARIERLTAQGLALTRAPASLAPRANALLRAPEGTLLLLRTA